MADRFGLLFLNGDGGLVQPVCILVQGFPLFAQQVFEVLRRRLSQIPNGTDAAL